ncbi:MAG: type II toxin-antitoxin system HicA family toxin [Synergistaceae bacterium]|nr:type II toxin-antitoxin system HicA family toxin [Synergistota bacterium]NLM72177.1 type II toxin-antitoxin system HicA family toxin [Synergistaceae bacterium]
MPTSKELIRLIESDGWYLVKIEGGHHHFKHPTKPGKVTVPHPRENVHPKTFKSALRQAGLL